MLRLVLLWALCMPAVGRAACETGLQDTDTDTDTGQPHEDCDGDGYAADEGDCNDRNPGVNPGEVERCDDADDNNCDGFYNESCDWDYSRASLQGGASCGQQGTETWPVLLPFLGLFLVLRQKRRSAR